MEYSYIVVELDKAIARAEEILSNLHTARSILADDVEVVASASVPMNKKKVVDIADHPQHKQAVRSAAVRKRMSRAQKRRWRLLRQEQASHKHASGKQRRQA